jgi:signal recognition particle subunit SRP19
MGKKKGGVRVKQVGPKQPAPFNPLEAMQPPPDLEEIKLPQKPDSKYQIMWPIHETFTMDPTGFQVIYPTYLDVKKTVNQGRRLPKTHAVPTPTVLDLSQALQMLSIRHVTQPYKCYSRDAAWENPGRVLVDLDAANLNKRQLMQELAGKIPDLPMRIQRMLQQEEERVQQEAAQAAKVVAIAPKKAEKKKGKKGRK